MKNIIIYTKKYPLNFDSDGVAQVDVSSLVEELSKDYHLMDSNPTVTILDGFQFISLKLSKKDERQKIGF